MPSFVRLLPSLLATLSVTVNAAPVPLPGEADWAALNRSVGGRLEVVRPLALPCYGLYANSSRTSLNVPSPGECLAVVQRMSDGNYIADHLGGYVTYNFGTCQATNKGCPALSVEQAVGSCNQGSIPSYGINVNSPDDVAAGLEFARNYSVPLVVKNTGHDYKGRSAAPGSLALWMRNVQPPVIYHSDFLPDNCAEPAGHAATYGAGQNFKGLFEAAHANGMMAIGGTAPTVGASGGWITGGGHSALSPNYGLGVDNVLQMRAVLPNGTYVTANRCQNSDIFFALRGGGGGTFGVVMETTSRVYPEVPIQYVQIIAPNLDLVDGIDQTAALLVNNTPKWSADGWGGYMAYGVDGIGALFMSLITTQLTLEEAKESMRPALEFANSLIPHLSVPLTANVTTFANYLDYFNSPLAQELGSQGIGEGFIGASKLIPKVNFSPANRPQLLDKLVEASQPAHASAGILMVPPANYELPESDQDGGPGQSSVTPLWRESYWHMFFVESWQQNDPTFGGEGSAKAAFQSATDTANILRAFLPAGAYQNEGDTYEPDFGVSFFGDQNYQRLLGIKSELDPDNVMTCHQCVGWVENDERYACYPAVT